LAALPIAQGITLELVEPAATRYSPHPTALSQTEVAVKPDVVVSDDGLPVYTPDITMDPDGHEVVAAQADVVAAPDPTHDHTAPGIGPASSYKLTTQAPVALLTVTDSGPPSGSKAHHICSRLLPLNTAPSEAKARPAVLVSVFPALLNPVDSDDVTTTMSPAATLDANDVEHELMEVHSVPCTCGVDDWARAHGTSASVPSANRTSTSRAYSFLLDLLRFLYFTMMAPAVPSASS
jgi:hypothetical protein